MELIIVLLFFSISGSVVMAMFVTADSMAEHTSITERAVMDVQSVSEIYAGDGDMRGAADRVFGKGWYAESEDEHLIVVLDENMQAQFTPEAREKFGKVYIDLSEERSDGECGELCRLTARVVLMMNGGEVVYSQVSSAYIPDFRKEAAYEEE